MLNEIANKVLENKHLADLLIKLDYHVAYSVLKYPSPANNVLANQEIGCLIRFADILSFSKEDKGRNISYRIISLLLEYCESSAVHSVILKSILVRLGNFPAISYLNQNKEDVNMPLPLENRYEESVKRDLQVVPFNSELAFTDIQYKIFRLLKNSDHFSFSGPTSLGKSFIIESLIKSLIFDKNTKNNIAILVPTRALINQNLSRLRGELAPYKKESQTAYQLLAHPRIPEYIKNKNTQYVFIFTPERLISYMSDYANPPIGYLFIDEAHKVIAEKDQRSPLYYHAIRQAQKKSVKLYFASPNIANPEIYLNLFDRSTDESVYTNESPVSQNKYMLDLENHRMTIFCATDRTRNIILKDRMSLFDWIKRITGDEAKSIIYCNSPSQTRYSALKFSEDLLDKKNHEVDRLISLIKKTIHKSYFLIDCLRKGVGYHFGNLPQRIRVRVEELFKKGELTYLFCTSTLMEGVNLPAKNIFIVNDKIGSAKLQRVDFLNLIGRAGRLAKELSGNIFIVKEDQSDMWKKEDMQDLLSSKSAPEAESQIVNGKKKFYSNVFRSIKGQELSNKNTPGYAREILHHYSNIALIHDKEGTSSLLLKNLLEDEPEAGNFLKEKMSSITVPLEILRISSSVKAGYQQAILNLDTNTIPMLDSNINYEKIKEVLLFFYHHYSWADEEAGNKKILKKAKGFENQKKMLSYYAGLLHSWMHSQPIKFLIANHINHYDGYNKKILLPQEGVLNLVEFDKNDKVHINILIDQLLDDVENLIRFRFVKYFNNYYLLSKEMLGSDVALSNWADFLEYGSTKKQIIELQNMGLPRHLALHMLENLHDYVEFDENDNLTEMKVNELLNKIKESDTEEDLELIELFSPRE